MNRQRGMTLVELLISVTIVMVIIAAATTAYLKLLRTYRTQGRLAESYMANLTGLEMLRYDIEMAGFGLPESQGGSTTLINSALGAINYLEAAAVTPETTFTAPTNPNATPPYDPSTSILNDAPTSVPRAFAHLDNQSNAGMGVARSDVLSIKSTSANINITSKKWSMITNAGANPIVKEWGVTAPDAVMDFTVGPPADNVIVLDYNGNPVVNGGQWCYAFNTNYFTNASPLGTPGSYVYYVYGLDNNPGPGAHRMPFNRVDYYLDRIKSDFPTTCDKNTFTLYRSVVDQQTGKLLNQAPLVDCVADFQVAFGIFPNGVPTQPQAIQWQSNLLQQSWMTNYVAGRQMSAWQIQQYLRDVRIFIIYQDGLGNTGNSSDTSSQFRFSGALNEGDQDIANGIDPTDYSTVPNGFNQWSSTAVTNGALNTYTPAGSDLQYRWKMLEMDVKPMNLNSLTQR